MNPAHRLPQEHNLGRFSGAREDPLLRSSNARKKLRLASKGFELGAFACDHLAYRLFECGDGAFGRCVGFRPIGGAGVGWRSQQWRCSLCSRLGTSISTNSRQGP